MTADQISVTAEDRTTQRYPLDRNADVVYLRALGAVHDLLQTAPNGPHAGEALLLAGIGYEVLSPDKIEVLHESVYEACVL